jgi:type IV pilus assembly protein PilV
MSRRHPASPMLGFSLVEVMVALIIICVGLLGIAKLQALMLSNTGASRTQALAALEASSIAATMHADRKYWAGAAPATTTTVNDIAGSEGITSTDAVLQTSPDCMLNGADWPCSSAKIAAYDLQNWMGDMFTTLPGSKTLIACAPILGAVTCTITISWQEKTGTVNSQETATTFSSQTYQLVVDP